MTAEPLENRAVELLHALTGSREAQFHDGQWEAIRSLVEDRARVLVVQRTGWGKSAVYFIATRLLRDAGSGPTLLVSPLLALMRNQIEAASRMGVRAASINSANETDWAQVIRRLDADEVDLLLVSPERFANERFRTEVMDSLGSRAGLVVIDEAHCISDWGHDFRPDYRRIRRIVDLLRPGVPVLACTATANDRVVADVSNQLGPDLVLVRGPLARPGLALDVIDLPAPPQRLAWLATVIPALPGTGIVYCLTKRDVQLVTRWLQNEGIAAEGYTSESQDREEIERKLLANELKAVVATSALGMGFDKPDLAFVIHFQAPGSAIAYYQQVGRAGRQLDRSSGILLRGSEDREIQDWFIGRAFPTPEEEQQVITALESADGYVKLPALEAMVNVRQKRLLLLLKNLEVDGFVVAKGQSFQRTAKRYEHDIGRAARVTEHRYSEQAEMEAYAAPDLTCRMQHLQELLDDPVPAACGICDRCTGSELPRTVDFDLAARAASFIRDRPIRIEPRSRFPDRSRIPEDERMEEGRTLCVWRDGVWGDLVQRGKQVDGAFDHALVDALVELVQERWRPDPAPRWVAFVPSTRHPGLVPELARRLAVALQLPLYEGIHKVRHTPEQKDRENSSQQFANVDGAFAISEPIPAGPALLVDDIVDSRWTLTEISRLLRRAGCPAVHPVALADAGAS